MAESASDLLTTADGRPLKAALAAAQARARRRAFLLVLPLLAFVLLTFICRGAFCTANQLFKYFATAGIIIVTITALNFTLYGLRTDIPGRPAHEILSYYHKLHVLVLFRIVFVLILFSPALLIATNFAAVDWRELPNYQFAYDCLLFSIEAYLLFKLLPSRFNAFFL